MASWSPPQTIAAGAPLPSAYFNTVVNNEFFLYQKPMTSVFDSVGTSIPNQANTVVTTGGLGGTFYSSYGFANNNNTIIIPQSGIYQISFRVTFNITALSIVGGGGQALLFNESGMGGGPTSGSWVTFTSAVQPTTLTSVGSCILPCSTAEGIYLVAYQNNEGSVTVPTITGQGATGIDVVWLGSL